MVSIEKTAVFFLTSELFLHLNKTLKLSQKKNVSLSNLLINTIISTSLQMLQSEGVSQVLHHLIQYIVTFI